MIGIDIITVPGIHENHKETESDLLRVHFPGGIQNYNSGLVCRSVSFEPIKLALIFFAAHATILKLLYMHVEIEQHPHSLGNETKSS